jgi:hypothetical protein
MTHGEHFGVLLIVFSRCYFDIASMPSGFRLDKPERGMSDRIP